MEMATTYVIVGGDAAGLSAASKIKRKEPEAEVIVFEKSETISYSACGMPYWIGGVISSDEQLLVLKPDVARKKRGLDVRIHHEVVAINPAAHQVTVHRIDTGEQFTQDYEKLILATGAAAIRPPIPGIELPGVFTLRALSDAQRIYAFMATHQPKRAVVVGGGYIGVEMAEALRDRELDVTLLEGLPTILPNFDPEMVEDAATHVQAKGVTVLTETMLAAITQRDASLQVATNTGAILPADLVIVAIGVRPNSKLAADAGLALGAGGAIAVDAQMRTNAPDIYAAGDCAEHFHLVSQQKVWIPLAPSANKGGRIAGDNASGAVVDFPGILGTMIVKVFDYTLAATGLTERQAKKSGLFGEEGDDVGSAVITAYDRAHYWPGAAKIKVKLVFQKSRGRLLGGQLAGKAGVNKRIDIIAVAITARMTTDDLGMLDLSYAPPYSPVYDPVQVAANVAGKGE
jgi:NADPH-dependent 2,4-dienoyl-CoA reductase/sulfur reductase-like enzyme